MIFWMLGIAKGDFHIIAVSLSQHMLHSQRGILKCLGIGIIAHNRIEVATARGESDLLVDLERRVIKRASPTATFPTYVPVDLRSKSQARYLNNTYL